MPYALIPDGYTLKKVTKTQEKAVKDLRRSEYIKELIDNETTLPILLGSVFAITGGILIDRFLSELDLPDIPTLGPEAINRAKRSAVSATVDMQKINPVFAPFFLADKVLFDSKAESQLEAGLMNLFSRDKRKK